MKDTKPQDNDKTAQMPALKKRISSLFKVLDRWDKSSQSIGVVEQDEILDFKSK